MVVILVVLSYPDLGFMKDEMQETAINHTSDCGPHQNPAVYNH